MPLVVIPDFTVTAKPAIADVRNAEKALVQVIGGVHEGTRYPGDLDGNNIDPAIVFPLRLQAEPFHRHVLSTGRSTDMGAGEAQIPSEAGPKCILLVGVDFAADTVTFWHSDSNALNGKVAVYKNGNFLTNLDFPVAGLAQGAFIEFPFSHELVSGDVLDFRWLDGTNLLKKAADSTAPQGYTRAFVQIWGALHHIA